MKTLYFDCFSGISGGMTIGALLDLGLDFDYLKTELKKLPVEGYELRASRVMRSNLSAMKFDVLMEGDGGPATACSHLPEACSNRTCDSYGRCHSCGSGQPVWSDACLFLRPDWLWSGYQTVSRLSQLPPADDRRRDSRAA